MEVVNYLLECRAAFVANASITRNAQNELPIHLLCQDGENRVVEGRSRSYTETIWLMLLSNPEVVSIGSS